MAYLSDAMNSGKKQKPTRSLNSGTAVAVDREKLKLETVQTADRGSGQRFPGRGHRKGTGHSPPASPHGQGASGTSGGECVVGKEPTVRTQRPPAGAPGEQTLSSVGPQARGHRKEHEEKQASVGELEGR